MDEYTAKVLLSGLAQLAAEEHEDFEKKSLSVLREIVKAGHVVLVKEHLEDQWLLELLAGFGLKKLLEGDNSG